jgi:hypothetical protein
VEAKRKVLVTIDIHSKLSKVHLQKSLNAKVVLEDYAAKNRILFSDIKVIFYLQEKNPM